MSRTNKMTTYIHFDEMHFYAYHGVDPQEQMVGNNFSINLTLQVPFEAALRNDTLANTVNYATIYEVVEHVMSEPSKLLENVVGRIISSIKSHFPKVKGGRIALYKENPPITGKIDRVGVIVEW